MRKLFFFGILLVLCSSGYGQSRKAVIKPAAVQPGKKVYEEYCLSCHQGDGLGVPGMNPPISKTEWVLGDKTKLIKIVLNGLTAPITINGEQFHNPMPSHDFLTDQQIADVLSFIRVNFGNNAPAVTAAEVQTARAVKK